MQSITLNITCMGIHMCTKCTFCYALCFLFVFFVCVFVSSFSFSCLHHFVCVFVSSFSFFMFASPYCPNQTGETLSRHYRVGISPWSYRNLSVVLLYLLRAHPMPALSKLPAPKVHTQNKACFLVFY